MERLVGFGWGDLGLGWRETEELVGVVRLHRVLGFSVVRGLVVLVVEELGHRLLRLGAGDRRDVAGETAGESTWKAGTDGL